MKIGIWIFALGTIITGVLNVVWGAFDASHQPIAAFGVGAVTLKVLAYLSGVLLIAGGIALLSPITERIGAAVSAVMYLFFALLWVPRFSSATHAYGYHLGVVLFVLLGISQQLMLMSPALLVTWQERGILAARWMLGVGPIIFGLAHLVSLNIFTRFVPHWIPFPVFWVIFTGLAFLLAGIAIVSRKWDLLATRLLALMLLLFEFIVEVPPIFAQPHSQSAWAGAAYNVVAIGACVVFSEFVLQAEPARRTVFVSGSATAQQGSLIA
jgi:uncharacterized membrane protein